MSVIQSLEVVSTLFDVDGGREAGFKRMNSVAADMGFPYCICAPVRNHPQADRQWAFTSYPAKWQEIYVEKQYLPRNPIRRHALTSARAFVWSELERDLPEAERDLFRDCRACGMEDGVVVPVHGPWGQVITIGFATDRVAAITPAAIQKLQVLANCFTSVFNDESYASAIHLTEREQEILLRVAQGYGGFQVAKLLELSPNSIEWHMKNIFNKLCVRNRTAAVVKAVQLGLIQI
ncbi:hypothetical protein A6A04_13795 [Paramagnetospirillum marisnigri]|uniref:HTH luxR-type domain-containing protein n=1 Tax=Paramagnetospirillum marisnigri TaxID=1285242 RepID=A0A178MV58_9PROT|nr:autoinducer binding domain-containing protein [Paramagnetospirillum marisnigri]OAN53957.1 hypothetical protein A6A04_13795 [Paramagnetospirillum marisnigri]